MENDLWHAAKLTFKLSPFPNLKSPLFSGLHHGTVQRLAQSRFFKLPLPQISTSGADLVLAAPTGPRTYFLAVCLWCVVDMHACRPEVVPVSVLRPNARGAYIIWRFCLYNMSWLPTAAAAHNTLLYWMAVCMSTDKHPMSGHRGKEWRLQTSTSENFTETPRCLQEALTPFYFIPLLYSADYDWREKRNPLRSFCRKRSSESVSIWVLGGDLLVCHHQDGLHPFHHRQGNCDRRPRHSPCRFIEKGLSSSKSLIPSIGSVRL